MSNQYTYSVPFTEEELHDCYVNQGMSQAEIGVKFGTTQKVVWRAMKKMGIPTRKSAPRNQADSLNNNWRGGRVLQGKKAKHGPINDRGYWYIRDPAHAHATKNGYVAEHIVVATNIIGRPLKYNEVVHHINLKKEDNRPDNLIILTRKRHAQLHAQLDAVAAKLLEENIIAFTAEEGYVLST